MAVMAADLPALRAAGAGLQASSDRHFPPPSSRGQAQVAHKSTSQLCCQAQLVSTSSLFPEPTYPVQGRGLLSALKHSDDDVAWDTPFSKVPTLPLLGEAGPSLCCPALRLTCSSTIQERGKLFPSIGSAMGAGRTGGWRPPSKVYAAPPCLAQTQLGARVTKHEIQINVLFSQDVTFKSGPESTQIDCNPSPRAHQLAPGPQAHQPLRHPSKRLSQRSPAHRDRRAGGFVPRQAG